MINVRTILMYSNGLQTTGAVRLPEKDLIHVFFSANTIFIGKIEQPSEAIKIGVSLVVMETTKTQQNRLETVQS